MRRIIRPKSEIPTVFRPKNRWSPKKKKKVINRNWKGFFGEIGNSNNYSGRITATPSPLQHPNPFGGAVFIFWAKLDLKTSKNVRFCILFRPMGGLERDVTYVWPVYLSINIYESCCNFNEMHWKHNLFCSSKIGGRMVLQLYWGN